MDMETTERDSDLPSELDDAKEWEKDWAKIRGHSKCCLTIKFLARQNAFVVHSDVTMQDSAGDLYKRLPTRLFVKVSGKH